MQFFALWYSNLKINKGKPMSSLWVKEKNISYFNSILKSNFFILKHGSQFNVHNDCKL